MIAAVLPLPRRHPKAFLLVMAIGWFALYLGLEPLSEWLVSLLPVSRASHLGGAIQFFLFVTPKVSELLARDVTRPSDAPPHTLLSNREFEIFTSIVRGMTLTDIAQALSLSIKTVSTHKTHILEKMNASSSVELVRYALDHGLLDIPPE